VAAIPAVALLRNAAAGQRLARLCFAKNPETLDAAIARLEKV
jgi:methionine aminotransferase